MNLITKISLLFFVLFLISCTDNKKDFRFQALTYHYDGSGCEGLCPTFHLSIDSTKKILLHMEYVHKPYEEFVRLRDSVYLALRVTDSTIYTDSLLLIIRNAYMDKSKVGSFSGQVNDSLFQKLINSISDAGLDTLKFENIRCFDSGMELLKINYNNTEKTYRNNCANKNISEISKTLLEITKQNNLIRQNQTIIID